MRKSAQALTVRRCLAGLALVLLAIGVWQASARWAMRRAIAETDGEARQDARTHAGLLASELQKFRLLPLILADYPDVLAALQDRTPGLVERVDARLELLANRTDAAAIYVIDPTGRTVAASNWRLPTSFVGQNYGFRPYFHDALRAGSAELFALGTVSGRPGLFLARRIGPAARSLGVVVVKVEFDRLERGWAAPAGHTLVVDRRGVILITGDPGWRFTATRPLSPADAAQARRSLQFGAVSLRAAPVTMHGSTATLTSDRRETFRVAALPVPLAGASLIHLEPLRPALAAATASARLWALALLIALLTVAGVMLRARERRLLLEAARRSLEVEVARRTAELRDANDALVVRSRERAESDRRFRAAREELAQANRLASLGQITAGVAHEINQPVAAIRTFAENAALFLDRGRADTAGENLGHIVSLTERIGTITAELRGFARRRTPDTGSVALTSVIEGALLLAGDRVRDIVRLDVPQAARGLAVVGDRVRLEQVVLNLLQNAAEAMAGDTDPHIDVSIDTRSGIALSVADNGGGVDAGIADQIFTPFVSGKPDGLGLGLGIARDIAREFGGELDWRPCVGGGACFTLHLKAA